MDSNGFNVSSSVESVEEVYDLSSIITPMIVPTDLNAYMYRFERHLYRMAQSLGFNEESSTYETAAERRRYAINTLMWNSSTSR